MSSIEFPVPQPETLSDRVKRQFGSAPRSIVRAVAKYMEKNPGNLDDYHLEIIAAAAPVIGDPKLVAELIDALPVTRMHVVTSEIDIRTWRKKFEVALPHYPTVTRKNLVGNLVEESMLHTLDSVPTDRLTPEGSAAHNEAIARGVSGSAVSLMNAANSPHMSHQLAVEVLDEVERRIERSERGTPTRPAQKLPIDVVGGALLPLLRSENEAATDEDRVRAWNLAMRCEMIPQWQRYLVDVALGDRALPAPVFPTLLDQIALLEEPHRGERLYGLLHQPKLDEQLARKAVQMGATAHGWPFDIGHSRLAFVRFQTYREESSTDDLLPDNLSDQEIDARVADHPRRLMPYVIDEMKTPSALQELVRREDELAFYEFSALLRNPALDVETAIDAANRRRERVPVELVGVPTYEQAAETVRAPLPALMDDDGRAVHGYNLMRRPGIDVETASRLFSDADPLHLKYLIKGALCNVSVDPNPALEQLVLDVLKQQLEMNPWMRAGRPGEVFDQASGRELETLFEELAANSSNPVVHQQLVDVAVLTRSPGIIEPLARNPWVHREMLYSTAELYGGVREARNPAAFFGDRPSGDTQGWTYHPSALEREAIDNGSGRFIIKTLIEGCIEGPEGPLPNHHYATEKERTEAFHAAVGELIEHDLLTLHDWALLVGGEDEHTAYRYLTHPKCPWNAGRFVSRAERDLTDTARTIENGLSELPPRDRSLKWSDLPNSLDEPLPRTELSDMINGQTIAGLTMRTPRTERELRSVADRMGNCVAGFVDGVRAGTHVVAHADAEQCSYAAVWNVIRNNKLALYEVNTNFNTGKVPADLRAGVDKLTADVNEGRIVPVVKVAEPETAATPMIDAVSGTETRAGEPADPAPVSADDLAEPSVVEQVARLDDEQPVEHDEHPQVVRRPPVRTARIALHTDGQQVDNSEAVVPHPAPSVLTTAAAEADEQAVDIVAPEISASPSGPQAATGHEDLTI